ncbi:hypothetical protein CEXT_706101 [Caerostris extrusa]|uniref:Uncharacterized protein n=1 Tax=Caerostris extrusa TaxID=172846 RepID=A0AAV4XCA6_CAEEX|nr:hypothetical protein CEXT_706101 [Caerostris extrusa]
MPKDTYVFHSKFVYSIDGVRQSSPLLSRTKPRTELPAIPEFCLGYAARGFCVWGSRVCAGIIRVVMNELGEGISHNASNCDITVFQSVCHLNNGVCQRWVGKMLWIHFQVSSGMSAQGLRDCEIFKLLLRNTRCKIPQQFCRESY